MTGISDALTEIDNLKPGKKFVYTKIAEKHSVNRNTLSRAHQGVQVPQRVANESQKKLNNQQELDLVKYILQLSERHLAPTRRMIQNFASSVASQPCSNMWVQRFLYRHHKQLKYAWVTSMDLNRHNAKSQYKYKSYFVLLQQKVTQYNILPENTYNMDKKGFAIGVLGRTKQVFSRRQYKKKEVRQALQDGSRE
jgi:hypothetical protein